MEQGIRDFRKFINCAYFSESKLAISLFKYLYKNRKNLENNTLDSTSMFQSIYGTQVKFNSVKLERVILKLTKMMDSFLVQKELENDNYQFYIYLSKAYHKNQLSPLAIKLLNRIEKVLPDEEVAQYRAKAMLNYDLYFDIKANLNKEKKSQKNLDLFDENNNAQFAINKQKYYCEKLVRKAIFGEKLSEDFDKSYTAFIHFLNTLKCKNTLIIKLFVQAAEFLKEPDLKKYEQFKADFMANETSLNSEKKALLLYLSNGLTFVKHPEGQLLENFKLCKIGIEFGLFIENNRMSPSHFNNIINIACQLKEYEWVNDFINSHSKFLLKDNKTDNLENNKLLYSCQLYFGNGEYRKVITNLKDIQYDDFSYGLRRFTLELKSYYELEKQDSYPIIDDRSSTFSKYLLRKYNANYISKVIKNRNNNFIKVLKLIANFQYSEITKKDLLQRLKSLEGNIIEFEWLLEKIKSLE